jgi:gliding motility-associated-like protein
VYTNPVIEPSVNPVDAVLCEGDLMAFEDLNTAAGNITYDFVTDQGFEQLGTAADNCEFEMFVPGTCFEVVKTQSFATQGITTLCTATWDTCFVVNPLPVISLTHPDAICQGDLANVGVEVTNWDASCTYDCSLNNLQGGFVAGDNDDPSDNLGALCDFMLTNTSGIDVAPSPSMSLELVVTDCKGCVSAPAQVTIDVYATPITAVVDSLYDTMCSPTSDCVQLDILNEGLPVGTLTEYFWENNPGTLSSQYCDNFVNSTPCPLDQTVEWTVRFTHQAADGSNVYCTSSNLDSTVVFPTPEPSFEFVSPQICYDPEGDNCAEIIHDVANYDVCPTDTLTFEWYTSAVAPLIQNQVHLTNPTAVVPVVCADSVGVFEVILEATNSYGCSQTTQAQEFTIRELPEPELTFLQSSVCLPTTVTIINSSSGVSDYTMEIPGYPFFENFESPLTLDVVYPGYYNAEFVVCKDHVIAELDSYLTCCVEVEYEEVFEGCTPPVASFTVLPDTAIEYVNPVVHFENTSVGQVENIWSFGDGEGSSEVNPEWEYLASGVYNAQLLVVNECGCTDVASQEIRVTTDLYVYVPNAFTPNNDGLNDAWFPSIIGQELISKYEVWVYNRNGHLVFHSTNPNEAWTGENDVTGEGLHFTGTSDVYSWRIAIKKKDGQGAKIYTGHVTMVR